MKAVTSEVMRELDRRTIEEYGTPGQVLMERAGVGSARQILDYVSELHPSHIRRFVVLAGKGNNGGDGYVVAKFLLDHTDVDVALLSTCPVEELKGDALYHAQKLPQTVLFEVPMELTPAEFYPGDIIIDALLGTGIEGPLRAPYDQWITAVNASGCPVISLDIPSGLNGNTGLFETAAVIADVTVTMALPKVGMVIGQGPEVCGRLRCVDIGIPEDFVNDADGRHEVVFAHTAAQFLGRIPVNAHKGTQGRILVVGGSRMYRGAPILAAEAALRAGGGLVTAAVPAGMDIPGSAALATIIRPVADGGSGSLGEDSVPDLRELAGGADVIAVGPGMGNSDDALPVLELLNDLGVPVIYDADAINIIARNPDMFQPSGLAVLTPHPGEMARLMNGLGLVLPKNADRLDQATAVAAALNSYIVLKGNRTVIASPAGDVAFNSSGSPSLATAGSGDVLCGMIAAFLAGSEPMEAIKAAVFVHGAAGELSYSGIRGLIADDLMELVPQVMKKLSPFA